MKVYVCACAKEGFIKRRARDEKLEGKGFGWSSRRVREQEAYRHSIERFKNLMGYVPCKRSLLI